MPPSKSALAAGIKALRAETLEQINRWLVRLAAAQGIESGRKVRVDTTVVKSLIHEPSDSELLWDGVLMLTRLMRRAQRLLAGSCPSFPNRTQRAKRRRLGVLNAKNKRQRRRAYRDLVLVAKEVVGRAGDVRQAPHGRSDPRAMALAAELNHYATLTRQVIWQTRRRVFEGQVVPAHEKVVSLFEEHTDIICKDRRETFFGHKICGNTYINGRSCRAPQALGEAVVEPDTTPPPVAAEPASNPARWPQHGAEMTPSGDPDRR